MKEKSLLYIFSIVVFLILSVLFVFFIEGQIKEKQMSFYWENEKVITRLYQVLRNGQSLDETLKGESDHILSLGFYNYFGDSMYLFGNAPLSVSSEKILERVDFKDRGNTFVVKRDFLSPFDPMKRILGDPDEINRRILAQNSQWTLEEKQNLIRFVYLEVPDYMIDFFMVRFRIIQFLVVLLIITILLFFISTYKRNMVYRAQIESSERLVVLGTAARTLTHEIKNPLSIIRLQSAIIERSSFGNLEQPVNIINEEVARVTALTERVTDFLRQPAGVSEEICVNRSIQNFIKHRGVELKLNLPEDDLYIFMDINRFNSVLDNLINNAIESDSLLDDIGIYAARSGSNVEIKVEDKGCGIKEDSLATLFDPFFTTKSKGSGLGLSIVSSYIRAAGGSVDVTSTFGVGTVIKLSLPLIKFSGVV